MLDVSQKDVDELVRSLLNYYLLVRCGALRDNKVTPQFLDAVKEISRKGIYIFEER